MTERTFKANEKEYNNLLMAAGIMTVMSGNDHYHIVKDCYFDAGQDWMWTTIIEVNPNETGILHSWQAINSRDWKLIVAANSKQEILEIMKSIIK